VIGRLLTPRIIILAIGAAGIVSLSRFGLLDAAEWLRAFERLADFATSLWPPNTDVLSTLVDAMVETLEMAFVGTLLGFAMALPAAVLATRRLFGPLIVVPSRLFLGAVRTVPSLLWAVVFVVGFGLGPAAGALAVAMYSLGYMSKLLYETFEGVDEEVLEAVRAVGASRLQLIVYAVLPEAANNIVSQVLFMFEYNIRASSIMGFVGAGGIGYYMLGYLQVLDYASLMMALVVTFCVVMAVDYLSARVRALIDPRQRPPRRRRFLLAGLVPQP
jgi:phosphonate transport system permease protein